jgi:hypothetical protein
LKCDFKPFDEQAKSGKVKRQRGDTYLTLVCRPTWIVQSLEKPEKYWSFQPAL